MKYNDVKMIDAKNSANAFKSTVFVFTLLFEAFFVTAPIVFITLEW